jgi:UDP-N-acetylglucosamine diphosphorylase/glucosamine-1-phosphate N-acetyltransferase
MSTILFDDHTRFKLLPFTHTRPVGDVRCGILTMRQRWEHFIPGPTGTISENYLQELFPLHAGMDNLFINGTIFATQELAHALQALPEGHKLVKDNVLIGFRTNNHVPQWEQIEKFTKLFNENNFEGDFKHLQNVWDIFSLNSFAIQHDIELLSHGCKSAPVPNGVTVIGKGKLFIEESAKILAGTIINTDAGAVYIGADAEVMEGCLLRGPIALCSHAVIKMGAKIYGATTIGPGCKVGGELNNVVFFANSNKAHDGFLGNAVIGEWCNLGADTNCSNLKNNYDEVQLWNEHLGRLVKTGLTFCGLIMGDHSKCGINTMFNTGTVVGVSCNIFGQGFPNKFIPSFCWGGSDAMSTYEFDKAMETIGRVMARRNLTLSVPEINLYRYIFENTSPQRNLFTQA